MATNIDVTFDEASHVYTVNRRIVPSVTQIIDNVLPDGYGPMSAEQRDYVMMRGRATHRGCQLLDQRVLDWNTVSPAIAGRLRAWEKFTREMSAWELTHNEVYFGSAAYGFAGTPDRVYHSRGLKRKRLLVDLKSTYIPHSRIQVGGYAKLLRENLVGPTDEGVIVVLDDDGTFKCHCLNAAEMLRMENTFAACLSVYGFKQTYNLK